MSSVKTFVKSSLAICRSLWFVVKHSRPSNLHQVHVGMGECAILGNGPSLQNDLITFDKAAYDSIFVVNRFAISDRYQQLKPSYYIIIDPCFWDPNLARDDLIKIRKEVFQMIREKTDWPMQLIMPTSALRSKVVSDEIKEHEYVNLISFNNCPVSGPSWFKHFLYQYGFGSPKTQNVLVAAIFCGIRLGFDKVSIFGADHSWHEDVFLNDENQVCLVDKHFYDAESSKPVGKPFMKPDKTVFTMSGLFAVLSSMFKGYEELASFAELSNTKIVNRSTSSYIDAFERIPNGPQVVDQ